MFETEADLRDRIIEITGLAVRCIQYAAAGHDNGLVQPAHPGPTFDIWFWGEQQSAFYERSASEGPWWENGDVEVDCT